MKTSPFGPVPGGALWVADEDGGALPDGEQGELFYRGPNTMMGYAVEDADLLQAQGSDILRTGDIARRLPNGAFEIVGRKSRFVKLFGLRIGLDEVEKHLSEQGVEAACVAHDDVLFVVVAGAGQDEAQTVASELREWLDIPATSFKVVPVEALPRQSSGKVDLSAIGALVDGMAKQAEADSRVRTPKAQPFFRSLMPRRNSSVVDVFAAHFPEYQVSPNASFNSLGGDSLSYVAVSLELESLLGQLPQDWQDMTAAELQAKAGDAQLIRAMDSPTLIRALSIMLIVAGHFNFLNYGGGGASALFVIAGISFASFTLPQVLKEGTGFPVITTGVRIALITFAYTLLNYTVTGYGAWPAFVFVGNWISPHTQGSAWFIEVYLQLLIVLALALAIPKTRDVIAQAPFSAAVAAASTMVVIAALSDQVVDTHHLYRRLPHLYAWVFLVGVAIGFAKTLPDRLIVTVIFCLGVWQFSGFTTFVDQMTSYFPLAVLVLIWLPSVPIPRPASVFLRMVAGASLFIYLSHFQFAQVSTHLFGKVAGLDWLFAIIGGVCVWHIYEKCEAIFRRHTRRVLQIPSRIR